ncbi:MAG: hypothetical protein IPL10_09130 [Bacteroidetes bacterium]|nr:hypothetical protein [Bacteroidota bacterium]
MKKNVTLLLLFLLFIGKINSQSITLSVANPECNQDGALIASVNGITPPYNVILYYYSVAPYNLVTTQTNVTTFTTQIGGNLSAGDFIVEVIQQ